MATQHPDIDDVTALDRIAHANLRLMAKTVSPATVRRLRDELNASPERYPWRDVTESILDESPDDRELIQRALRAQRDWLMRGGPATAGRRRRAPVKRFTALVLSRAIFFVLYTTAAVVLLVLLQARWPQLNIYEAADRIRDAFLQLTRG
ncbi:MAG: hypothetical protein AAF628_17895 [Planctomycetota bacterium]